MFVNLIQLLLWRQYKNDRLTFGVSDEQVSLRTKYFTYTKEKPVVGVFQTKIFLRFPCDNA